jgi:hypothetical protein
MPAMRRARPPRRSGGAATDRRYFFREVLALVAGPARPATRFFGARFCHAIVSAPCNVAASAAARRTRVQPRAPHPPRTGENTFGAVSISSPCWSGVSPITPQAASGLPRGREDLGVDAEVRGAHVRAFARPGQRQRDTAELVRSHILLRSENRERFQESGSRFSVRNAIDKESTAPSRQSPSLHRGRARTMLRDGRAGPHSPAA